jgi:hypothetical protein
MTSCAAAEDRESFTPRITAGSIPGELGERLLRAEDLRRVEEFGPEVVVRGAEGVELYENPDTRGPCGAQIEQPDLTSGGIVTFTTPEVTGFEAVIELAERDADQYFDALEADTDSGCPDWESRTNQGLLQTGQLLEVHHLDVDVDRSWGASLKILVDGQSAYVAAIALETGQNVAIINVFSRVSIESEMVVGIASEAAARLS